MIWGDSVSSEFTHFDEQGKARMVEVSGKKPTVRTAVAAGAVYMKKETLEKVSAGHMEKGDVLAVARVAGIMGAKRTGYIIPMCHPLMITGINIDFHFDHDSGKIGIEASVNIVARTGVEMEALMAVSIAGLTIYDMCKSADKQMVISDIQLREKKGGKSG